MNDNYNNLLSNMCWFIIKKYFNLIVQEKFTSLKEREPRRTP